MALFLPTGLGKRMPGCSLAIDSIVPTKVDDSIPPPIILAAAATDLADLAILTTPRARSAAAGYLWGARYWTVIRSTPCAQSQAR